MQSFLILAGAGMYTCWATAANGTVHRLHVYGHSQPDALEQAYRLMPRAIAMSARLIDGNQPGDALGKLNRRAVDVALP